MGGEGRGKPGGGKEGGRHAGPLGLKLQEEEEEKVPRGTEGPHVRGGGRG